MNRKMAGAFVLVFFLSVFFSVPADALHSKKSASHKSLKGRFYSNLKMILDNSKTLELTDEQEQKIKELFRETKKAIIRYDARIKTLTVEIDTMMWEMPYDIGGVNELVAQKYNTKKEKAHYLVSAHDRLNKILTKKQIEEANETISH